MTTYAIVEEDAESTKKFTVAVAEEDGSKEKEIIIVATYDPATDQTPEVDDIVSEIQDAIA